MLKRRLILSVLLFLLIFSSCAKKEEQMNYSFSVKDDRGNEVKFDSLPGRIISLAPNITEAVYAIGADSMLAGVTSFCDYPPSAKQKTIVGGLVDPNYEIITSLKPGIILMTEEGNLKSSYNTLQNLGLKVFISNPRNVQGIIKMINDIGQITGHKKTAENITAGIQNGKDELVKQNGTDKKNILLLISVNPLITANKNSFINEIIDLAGFENIYRDEPIDYPNINFEDIVKKDPGIIIIPTDTNDTKLKESYRNELTSKLSSVKAVKTGKIFFIDQNVVFRPGPRVIEAAKLLRNIAFSSNFN